MRLRWSFAILAVFGNVLAGGLHLHAVLTDTAFPPPGPYRLEVLETGDTLRIQPRTKFSIHLAPDTLWTLCVKRGDSADAFERCFEVRNRSSDSIINVELEGIGIALAEPESLSTSVEHFTPADSSSGISGGQAGGAEIESVRLQKVVLRAQRIPKWDAKLFPRN